MISFPSYLQLDEPSQLMQLTSEISQLQMQIDEALEDATAKKFKRYNKFTKTGITGTNAFTCTIFLTCVTGFLGIFCVVR